MAVNQLGYMGFGVSDMEKWEDYATNILGLEITERAEDGTVYLRMDENHHRISLHQDPSDDLMYVGWQCANREEYEKTKEALFQCGVEASQGSKEEIENRHVIDMVKFSLSGIRQEVYYGPHYLFERPFRPGAPVSGFVTGTQGLGHLGMLADDFDEMMRVLQEGLGFKMSDAMFGAERFLHVNGREHTVLALQHREGAKRIAHFMIQANDIDDVGMALDRVEDAGIQLQSRLGKHTNDHMISFYMQSPSGFGVEFGCNGRVVDDTTWQVGNYSKASIWGHRRPAGAPQMGPPPTARS